MEKPGRLQSIESQRFEHDWATNTFTFHMQNLRLHPRFMELESAHNLQIMSFVSITKFEKQWLIRSNVDGPTLTAHVIHLVAVVVQLCPTLECPWSVTHQAPLSRGFPRQEHWSGLPFPFPIQLVPSYQQYSVGKSPHYTRLLSQQPGSHGPGLWWVQCLGGPHTRMVSVYEASGSLRKRPDTPADLKCWASDPPAHLLP